MGNKKKIMANRKHFNRSPNGTKIFADLISDHVSYFNPGHHIEDVTEQLYGTSDPKDLSKPTMSGFATNAVKNAIHPSDGDKPIDPEIAMKEVMSFRNNMSFPTLYKLAQEFTVFDRWFASVPGCTFPNRHFINCATAGGYTRNHFKLLGYPMKTIFDSLNEKKIKWRYYVSGLAPTLYLYRSFRYPSNLLRTRTFKQFQKVARKGDLPAYSLYVF
jgi:phospholipase C